MAVRALNLTTLEVDLHGTPIGDVRFGILVPVLPDTVAMDAIDQAARKIAEDAGVTVERVIQRDPRLCIRCGRTLMRAAMGDHAARQAVRAALGGQPLKIGDPRRYRMIDRAMGQEILKVKRATEKLGHRVAAGHTTGIVEQVCRQAAEGNRWAPLYNQQTGAGWPMKVGQWQDYKSCACGEPETGQGPTDMGSTDPLGSQ